jgi:hypothetical protein
MIVYLIKGKMDLYEQSRLFDFCKKKKIISTNILSLIEVHGPYLTMTTLL